MSRRAIMGLIGSGMLAALAGSALSAGEGVQAGKQAAKKGEAKQAAAAKPRRALATFAGGCFWCMQPPFDKVPGVIETLAGYTGGRTENPTYEEVCSETTGHAEAVQVLFDPDKVSYERLLDVYWRSFDPTDAGGSFGDRGDSYRSSIWTHDEEQMRLALASKEKLSRSGRFDKPIVTPIVPAGRFWPAEEYHQKYYLKNPVRYKFYRYGSGRDAFLRKVWGVEADPPHE